MPHSSRPTRKTQAKSTNFVNAKLVQVPEIDPEKLGRALTAAVRILRADPTATVTVTEIDGGAQ